MKTPEMNRYEVPKVKILNIGIPLFLCASSVPESHAPAFEMDDEIIL